MITNIAQKLVCLIPRGLRVTNSALITKTANASDSHVTIECKGIVYSAHKILELLSIGMKHGDPAAISASGKDAEVTVGNIGRLLKEDVL